MRCDGPGVADSRLLGEILEHVRKISTPSQNGNGKSDLDARPLLSVSDFAAASGWSPFSIRQRCNKGVIEAEKHDRCHHNVPDCDRIVR